MSSVDPSAASDPNLAPSPAAAPEPSPIRPDDPLLVPILGMHRSGTSLVAQLLEQAGLYLGPRLMEGNVSNLVGHFETWDAVEINDELLARSGGDWAHPPAELSDSAASVPRIEGFLAELTQRPVAGWKDPRTVLTWPAWQPRLGRYRVVACLRHPLRVAHSLAARDDRPLDEGLALWREYNERLLALTDREAEVLWFDFDQSTAWIRAWLPAACRELGLAENTVVREGSFNEVLRHHQEVALELPAAERGLYLELWERAHRSEVRLSRRPVLGSRSAAAASAETPASRAILSDAVAELPAGASCSDPRLAELSAQVADLIRAVQLQNQVIQQDHLGHHHTRMHVDQALDIRLARSVGELGSRIEALDVARREALAGQSTRLAALQSRLDEQLAEHAREHREQSAQLPARLEGAFAAQFALLTEQVRGTLIHWEAGRVAADQAADARRASLLAAVEAQRDETLAQRDTIEAHRRALSAETAAARQLAEDLLQKMQHWEAPLHECARFVARIRQSPLFRLRRWLRTLGSPAAIAPGDLPPAATTSPPPPAVTDTATTSPATPDSAETNRRAA